MTYTLMSLGKFKREYPVAFGELDPDLLDIPEDEGGPDSYLVFGEYNGYPFYVYDNNCYYEMNVRLPTGWSHCMDEQTMKPAQACYSAAIRAMNASKEAASQRLNDAVTV